MEALAPAPTGAGRFSMLASDEPFVPLEEVDVAQSTAIPFTKPATKVLLNSKGQHTLEWSESLNLDKTSIPPGSLNLYTYPGGFSGPELALLKRVLLHMASSAPQLFDVPDPVGAYVIHALIVCNTEESLELSFAILDMLPRLVLQTHDAPIFTGEGSIHILCANRREEHACRMLGIAQKHLHHEELSSFLNTQASGLFFESPPMCSYGDSPLAYACVFGLRKLTRAMLDTGHVSLNSNPGEILGLYPLHAVVANGLRNEYDFLTSELPEALRADKDKYTEEGRLISMGMEQMQPMQLAATNGLRYMFQYIMSKESTRIMWTWGPVTQYQINLEGIDSAGQGGNDVMEVLAREGTSLSVKEFLLDDFMKGFLYALCMPRTDSPTPVPTRHVVDGVRSSLVAIDQKKWDKFGWYLHLIVRAFDAAVIAVVSYLAVAIKSEAHGEKGLHTTCVVLVVLIVAFAAVELFIGTLYAFNFKASLPMPERVRRTWQWMKDYAADTNLYACVLLLTAVYLYFSNEGSSSSMEPLLAEPSAGVTALTDGVDANLQAAERAAWHGIEPLEWLFFGLGFLLKFFAFIDQLARPYTSISTIVLSVSQVIRGPFVTFTFLFLMFLGSFTLTIISIFPDHPDMGPLPQAPDFTDSFDAAYAILMLGFVGEPLELQLHPTLWTPLGKWQKVNLIACAGVYIMYTFLSIILLLNLLIALLAANFTKTQEQSILQGRLALGRIVLRMELVANFFDIDTRATQIDDDGVERHVHNFRSVTKSGEVPRDHPDESVYDEMPPEHGAAKADVRAELDAVRKELSGQLDAVLQKLQKMK